MTGKTAVLVPFVYMPGPYTKTHAVPAVHTEPRGAKKSNHLKVRHDESEK
jgi:hypothetical protein